MKVQKSITLRAQVPSRSEVEDRNQYRAYKEELRADFRQRCGYCDALDEFFGGQRGYQIDHFAPKSLFPNLERSYSNLVYSCPLCNRAKSNKWVGVDCETPNDGVSGFVDPCDPDLDNHISRDAQGRIVANTELGEYMVSNLNLRLIRHQFVWQAQTLDLLASKLLELKSLVKTNTPKHLELLEALVDVFAAHREYRSNALSN